MRRKIKELKNNGFTLVEILVVLFIISLLMLLVLPNVTKHREKAQDTGDKALVSTVQTQVELYMLENNNEPATLDNIGLTQTQQTAAAEANITINPTTGEVIGSDSP